MNHAPRLAVAACLAMAACTRTPEAPPAASPSKESTPAPTNRVDIPASVRQNLGITFVKVETRNVAGVIRVPGRFELLSDARREYRTMLAGQVEPVVAQFQRVEPGDVLYRLRSPRWREMQQQIAEAEAAIRTAQASAETIGPLREAHTVHEESLKETVALWTNRIKQLEAIREAGGGKADELAEARATLTSARAGLAEVIEKDAELESREREIQVQLGAANARRELLLASAAAVTGVAAAELSAIDPATNLPRWRSIEILDIRSAAAGVIESINLTTGAWADESSLVLSSIQPERLRIHARGLQSDLDRLRDGLTARITPPSGGAGLHSQPAMSGVLVLGLSADPDERTVDLYVTPSDPQPWARPGVAASIEITLPGARTDLAIPVAAVMRDGLTSVIFKRDPKNPDKAIRMEADLGFSDGRWVVIASGVKEGDEIVVGGNYQLMLATSGSAAKGGHFHSDGTFHEGDH